MAVAPSLFVSPFSFPSIGNFRASRYLISRFQPPPLFSPSLPASSVGHQSIFSFALPTGAAFAISFPPQALLSASVNANPERPTRRNL